MESYEIRHLSFTYPEGKKESLKDISFKVSKGKFITLCGRSGCGKSTLLRHLKSCFTPEGKAEGEIFFEGRRLSELNQRSQSQRIGFVLQNPESQVVTDKVWHELAFGLESLGYGNEEIRTRVAEMASFFGIQTWFHKKTADLSGGQKQLLNLAAVMAMQPDVLILDEPTSQLDPIAAQNFLETIAKINRELGTTIILAEHRLEEVFPMSDRIIVMEEGRILADDVPHRIGKILKEKNSPMLSALPTPMKIYISVPASCQYPQLTPCENRPHPEEDCPQGCENRPHPEEDCPQGCENRPRSEEDCPQGDENRPREEGRCPVTVREGRVWLEKVVKRKGLRPEEGMVMDEKKPVKKDESVLFELREVWFRYEKEGPDVLKNLNMKVRKGELYTIVGGNGTGKTTTLSVIAGMLRPYRGQFSFKGQEIRRVRKEYGSRTGMLPQNPQTLFVKNTVLKDLKEMFSDQGKKLSEDKEALLRQVIEICELQELLEQHPYDLSGGEQQRAALGKVLLLQPEILLLDEPTKGLDACYKEKLAIILKKLKDQGTTIIMVSHDIEFCARYADRCAMFFDGSIISEGKPREFFAGKSFYTTVTNRMARNQFPMAIIPEDVISACSQEKINSHDRDEEADKHQQDGQDDRPGKQDKGSEELKKKMIMDTRGQENTQSAKHNRWLMFIVAFFIVPLTIWAGNVLFEDRKYYFISLLIILEVYIPFMMMFEKRKPRARELITVSVLCGIATAGRAAFFMLPQFKPVTAVVIISGICLGREAGFLVGSMTAFVSNMFFGQGPWTPWQMFAFGIIGFIAGSLPRKELFKKNRLVMCLFGALATFFIYGGIMNPASVIMWQAKPTIEMFISYYLTGIPFDMIHAVSTAVFLWFLAVPMIEKLDRVKIKYGMMNDKY